VRACSQRRAHFSGFLFCLLLVCAFVYFLRCSVELFVVVLYCTFKYGIGGRWWGDEWYLLIAGFAVYLFIDHAARSPKAIAGIERKDEQQNRRVKASKQTKQKKSPPSAPIHLLAVV